MNDFLPNIALKLTIVHSISLYNMNISIYIKLILLKSKTNTKNGIKLCHIPFMSILNFIDFLLSCYMIGKIHHVLIESVIVEPL